MIPHCPVVGAAGADQVYCESCWRLDPAKPSCSSPKRT
uniref:Uncharacterized protein n=1 Tax=Rhizophora mucronata TaxID=61149 RepID=A0A2P2PKQ9_RHIMU